MNLNLGCGKIRLPGYVGVDIHKTESIDLLANLFTFPWPIASESIDALHASHLIEHIPHTVRIRENGRLTPNWDEDGFFIFFREAWRVLKPGGLFTIIGPSTLTTEAFRDPTHTRYLDAHTFDYICYESPTFNYELGYRFDLMAVAIDVRPSWDELAGDENKAHYDFALNHYWDIIHDWKVTLRKA